MSHPCLNGTNLKRYFDQLITFYEWSNNNNKKALLKVHLEKNTFDRNNISNLFRSNEDGEE